MERCLLLAAAGGQMDYMQLVLVGGAVIAIIYFMMIRPQKKERDRVKNMLSGLSKNDEVLTAGGIYGRVVAVKEDVVILKIDDNSDVKIRVSKSAIAGVVKQSAEEGEKEDAKKE